MACVYAAHIYRYDPTRELRSRHIGIATRFNRLYGRRRAIFHYQGLGGSGDVDGTTKVRSCTSGDHAQRVASAAHAPTSLTQ